MATLITCALFATATGIVGAVVTLMGLLAFPAMLKAGYNTELAAGVVCAGGCLGIMIPPSVLLILYGATTSVSVVQLYAAAFIPGFLLAGFYIVYVIVRAMINPKLCPRPPELERPIPAGEVFWALLTSFFPLAILILSVLGAILFGLATPSEAAAVGAAGSLLIAAGYRSLTFQRMKEAVYLTARTSAMVCYLFIGSWTFSSVFSYLGGHEVIEHWVLAANLNATGFLILAQFIIFLLGWPLEWTEIIIIFVPIFLPLVKTFNIDPTLFGILVALNIQTSFNTPPMAMAAYYLKGVCAAAGKAEPDFRRRAAIRVHGVPDHDCWSTSSRTLRSGCLVSSTRTDAGRWQSDDTDGDRSRRKNRQRRNFARRSIPALASIALLRSKIRYALSPTSIRKMRWRRPARSTSAAATAMRSARCTAFRSP